MTKLVTRGKMEMFPKHFILLLTLSLIAYHRGILVKFFEPGAELDKVGPPGFCFAVPGGT